MRFAGIVLALAPLFSLAAHGQATPPADDRLRTVVMGIAPRRGVDDKELASALSDIVLGGYAGDARRVVIGPEDLRRALEWEASRQQAGCDDSKCLAEVGAALNAARIVAGTLDALGSGFLLTLSEIDASTLEPIARAQQEVAKDESQLVAATRALTHELLTKAGSAEATTKTSLFSGNAGSIEIVSDPRGAQVVVGAEIIGTTPTRIDNVAPGRHVVRLTRADYETVDVEIPVYPGGTTKVNAELCILRAIAEQNLEIRRAKWREADAWNQIGGWTKAGVGVAVGAGGALLALRSLGNGVGDGGFLSGVAVTSVGVALVAWGVIDLASPPKPPVPEWEIERKITVTPPKGDVEVKLIQQAPTSAQAR